MCYMTSFQGGECEARDKTGDRTNGMKRIVGLRRNYLRLP